DHARLECRARPWYGDVRESPSVAAIPLMPDGVFAINYNTFSSRAATKDLRLWITSQICNEAAGQVPVDNVGGGAVTRS
ncbi:MAG TPA: hypothetical protein VGE61_11365, partial [Glycomyces sp.]